MKNETSILILANTAGTVTGKMMIQVHGEGRTARVDVTKDQARDLIKALFIAIRHDAGPYREWIDINDLDDIPALERCADCGNEFQTFGVPADICGPCNREMKNDAD